MNTNLGIWIDHREAVIANASSKDGEVNRIESDMEKHVRFSGGAAAVTEEDIRDRRFANHLKAYFQEVIEQIRGADAIFIFGPGEAKGELSKRLDSENLGGHVVRVETVDKLTERQIAAKVREHFQI